MPNDRQIVNLNHHATGFFGGNFSLILHFGISCAWLAMYNFLPLIYSSLLRGNASHTYTEGVAGLPTSSKLRPSVRLHARKWSIPHRVTHLGLGQSPVRCLRSPETCMCSKFYWKQLLYKENNGVKSCWTTCAHEESKVSGSQSRTGNVFLLV